MSATTLRDMETTLINLVKIAIYHVGVVLGPLKLTALHATTQKAFYQRLTALVLLAQTNNSEMKLHNAAIPVIVLALLAMAL